jgi:ribosome-binding protein aMBF1 (putative translation factor)
MSVPAPQAEEPWASSPSVKASRVSSENFVQCDGPTTMAHEPRTSYPAHGIHSPNWRAEFAAERSNLTTAVRALIADYMEQWGISQAELAKRMGVSSSRVGKILSGTDNLTLRSLAAVAAALHARFGLTLHPKEDQSSPPHL